MGRRITNYRTEFVEYIPKIISPGILYISIEYKVAIHLCACGCGKEIVTPIDRNNGWIMTYDGENASLSPSIGNGRYDCRSHYFLKDGLIKWLPNFEDYQIEPVKPKKSWLKRTLLKLKKKK